MPYICVNEIKSVSLHVKMKKSLFAIFLLLAVAVSVKAQESQTAYDFLRLPVSAHAAALGGDNVTLIEDDAALTLHNPALLSSVSDKTIGLGFMTYMEGARMASATFSRTAGEKASWGVSAQYADYGKMKEMDENNRQTGEFSAKDIALNGTFSYQLGQHLVGGITAKVINSYIGQFNSLAVGVDMGLNYYLPDGEWSLSAVVKNLGGELDAYEEEYAKLPVDVQVGISKRLVGSPLRLSAAMVDLNHWGYKFINHFVVGMDVILSPQIYLAAGYNFRRANEMKIINTGDEKGSSHGAGLSLGAGVLLDRFKLNLSYAKYHVSSNSLMVNIAYTL